MSGHTSQNVLPRPAGRWPTRRRRTLTSVLAGLAFLVAVIVAVDRFPDTPLGRTIDLHLSQLADPQSWTP